MEQLEGKSAAEPAGSWKALSEGLWQVVSQVVEWGIPSLCYHCEEPVDPGLRMPLCCKCEDIGWKEPRCRRCASRCHPSEAKGPRCFHCKDVSYPQKSLQSLGPYQDWLRYAILRAKYAEDPVCTRYLRGLLAAWPDEAKGVLTYIPSHPKRLKERKARGQHLARILGRGAVWGQPECLLERVHYTKAQVYLRGDERRKSAQKFFRYIGPEVAPKEVILFDDVWTTGATARQAASTLREAGVKKVHIRVLAISDLKGRS